MSTDDVAADRSKPLDSIDGIGPCAEYGIWIRAHEADRTGLGVGAQGLDLGGIIHAPSGIMQCDAARHRGINGAKEIFAQSGCNVSGERGVRWLSHNPASR